MGLLNLLSKTGKVAKNVSKQVADDAGGIVKKTAKTIGDSRTAYSYLDFVDDGGGWDEGIRLLTGSRFKMTSNAAVMGLGGYALYQGGKTGVKLKNKTATGQMAGGQVPYSRLTQSPGYTAKVDDLGATGDMVFGMHNKR